MDETIGNRVTLFPADATTSEEGPSAWSPHGDGWWFGRSHIRP